ncbi:MAG: hypothetical protein ACTH5N_05845 [Psychroflexus halocasei]
MGIEARKIEFIQEFLKVQSEDVISRFEKLLREENNVSDEKRFEPMAIEELNRRINQSESDFENNRFKTSSELLAKYQ